MTAAKEIQEVSRDLAVWQTYEPSVKCECTASALRTEGGLVLIDPIPLTADAQAELDAFGTPAWIICTSGNHARAAAKFHRETGAPILAHSDAIPELELGDVKVDDLTTAELPGELEIATLPGAAAGEVAIRHRSGIVVIGDAIVHLPSTGLALLPDKYCSDAKLLRSSIQKLLRWEFQILTFAHGLPITASARERVAALLP